ncbi:MAG TPA: GWxTD domain-containing protein [Candidatus Acidoferrales bacterium]|nr:GWxTD domain-containing protein [Candidatus Acidoferrales bacterium]
MNLRRLVPCLALVLLAACAARSAAGRPVPEAAPTDPAAGEAHALTERAIAHIARRSIEGRRLAIAELERATVLEPDDASLELMLARTYWAAGFRRLALQRFERVLALQPHDPDAEYGVALVWRHDWLKYLDTTSLARAVDHLMEAVRDDSTRLEPWLMLSSLRFEQHDTTGSLAAAERAERLAPDRPEVELAVASAAWRLGDVERAERGFEAAIPRLPRNARERFEDIAPVASERDTALYNHLTPAAQAEFRRRFWKEQDPDLSTTENEAQLEYWARVAQAYSLYYDAHRREWDERGEVYVRYGPPEHAEYNPVGANLFTTIGQDSQTLYPLNLLVWSYPRLGMTVNLQDRLLSEYYLLPITYDHDPDPRPDPDSLARLDVVGTHDLRGVFPTLPPRTQRLPVEGEVAWFEGSAGSRLYEALEVPSTPAESLVADAVVLDSTQREVSRTAGALSPSACEASRYRVADFTADLPPGRYTVGFSVRGAGRRGSARLAIQVPAPDTSLALSGVVVTCGAPAEPGPTVRLEANPAARVRAGEPLTAYFEIYHLRTDAGGEARFEYVYRVRSADRDPRIWLQRVLAPHPPPPGIEASQMEENAGPLRRQFVSVPVQTLPPGHYRLEIQVRDRLTGAEASGSADFLHLAAEAPGAPKD